MYHGTSCSSADSIERYGFRQSRDGMLGAGVYCSRNIRKAIPYARKWNEAGGGVVFEVRVTVGRVAVIDHHGHALQKSWHDNGYDCAWVPPHTMNASGLEEHCVWDPARVAIVRRLSAAECAAGRTGTQQRCFPGVFLSNIVASCRQALARFAASVRSLTSQFLRLFRRGGNAVHPVCLPSHDLAAATTLNMNPPPAIASLFWSHIRLKLNLFAKMAGKFLKIVGRSVAAVSAMVAVSAAAALKAVPLALKHAIVRLQGPTSPPLRCNRVHPVNVAGVTPAHVSRPAAVSLVMGQTPQLVDSTRPSRHNELSLGFWSRVKNIVKAVAVAAVVAVASAGAALKRVYLLAGSGVASVANAMARLGALFPSMHHYASEPAPFSENRMDDTQPSPHAIATAAATSAPSACQRRVAKGIPIIPLAG